MSVDDNKANQQPQQDPCHVLDILCQKHSNLTKWKTTSPVEAAKVLQNNTLNKYTHEIEYIKKQLINKNININNVDNGEPKIIFHLTGFGEFHGVKDNPTTHIINNLSNYLLNNQNIPSNVSVSSMTVLHVSGVNSVKTLEEIRASNNTDNNNNNNVVYCYLHFGVAASRSILCLESTAYNCANFKGAPDQLGWEPVNEMIIKQNKSIYHEYYSSLPVDSLTNIMQNKGYKVKKSTDPGRYVCNWILYNSLHLSLDINNEHNMFIHVPKFDKINLDTQCKFAVDLIIEISKILSWKHKTKK